MERGGVGKLLADGKELAERIRTQVINGIDPYLQIVTLGARDEFTNLYLQDIWRYARLYWSISYQSTPGRNIFYLVRDRAGPNHPIIGISALGNPVLGLAPRDDFFGWSLKGIAKLLGNEEDPNRRNQLSNQLAARLYSVLIEALNDTYSEDLSVVWRPGVAWQPLVIHLENIARDAGHQRKATVDEKGDRTNDYEAIRAAQTLVTKGKGEDVDWVAIAKTPLYVRKRAKRLANTIRSLGVFADMAGDSEGGDVEKLLLSEEGKRAIVFALRCIKQDVIASSVMELITCGAVPPYNDALAGKLVALLMLSPKVAKDVEDRYTDAISLIASALRARPTSRPARLACLTTTSLYEINSSQYNRISFEYEGARLSYKKLGKTNSYGVVQFAPDTTFALQSLARLQTTGSRRVNNLFGEGASPKLRTTRDGLDALGLPSENFLRHHAPRLIYAAPICRNFSELAMGLTCPSSK
jgi:hypothetical protein